MWCPRCGRPRCLRARWRGRHQRRRRTAAGGRGTGRDRTLSCADHTAATRDTIGSPMLALSVLDQSPVRTGGTPAAAVQETLELAEACDRLGYRRYWLAEHHATPGLAGSCPEVLIGPVAARTDRIRVGSGGVMLQHYSALKVAEQFRMLETLFPGRIDLGIGRAPGSDQRTARALRERDDWFPQQVADVLAYLRDELPDEHPHAGVRDTGRADGARAVAAGLDGPERFARLSLRHGVLVRPFHRRGGRAGRRRRLQARVPAVIVARGAARERRRLRRLRRHGGRGASPGQEPRSLHRGA